MSALLSGLGLGFSLIIAIGAQNVFVLGQGIRRERVGLVVALCAGSDAVLILIGISGIGAVTSAVPWLVTALRWAGGLFLLGYGILAARRAIRPNSTQVGLAPEEDLATEGTSRVATAQRTSTTTTVVTTTLALTWLNPHVYLDTVVLLGSVGAGYGEARWVFAAGAMAASLIWFCGLGFGARFLGRWLSGPLAWRVLDAGIAVFMVVLGVVVLGSGSVLPG